MKEYFNLPKFDIKRMENSNELAVLDRATGKLIGTGKLVYSESKEDDNRSTD